MELKIDVGFLPRIDLLLLFHFNPSNMQSPTPIYTQNRMRKTIQIRVFHRFSALTLATAFIR